MKIVVNNAKYNKMIILAFVKEILQAAGIFTKMLMLLAWGPCRRATLGLQELRLARLS